MKRILWLFCAALCLVLLCACGKKQPKPAAPEPEPEPEPIRIESLECSDGELTLRFHRDDDGRWVWTDNPGFALDDACVDALVDDAVALDALSPVPDAEGPEFYGLYDTRKYVTTGYSDGTSVTWRFGSRTDDGLYYASPESDPSRICLASGVLLEQAGQGIYVMAVLPELPALTEDQIQSVTVDRGGETAKYTLYNDQWRKDSRDITDPAELQALSDLLAAPALLRCVDYAPPEDAAQICGLNPPAAVVTVNCTDPDVTYTLTVGTYAEDGAARFVTLGADTTIYLMDAAVLDPLSGANE